jgi:hypothetical protein
MQPRPPSPSDSEQPAISRQSTYATLLEKFKPGDLIFGISQTRQRVVDELEKHGYSHCFANALNDKTITKVIRNEPTDRLHVVKQAHGVFLNKHKTYLLSPHGKPIPALRYKGEVRSSAYRRACKLLLVDDAPERTYHTHVFVEGINWERVTTKTFVDALNVRHPDYSVTASEMRAAYRYYRDHGNEHPHITYYDEQGNILPQTPWQQPQLKPFFREYDRLHQLKIEAEEASTDVDTDPDEASCVAHATEDDSSEETSPLKKRRLIF